MKITFLREFYLAYFVQNTKFCQGAATRISQILMTDMANKLLEDFYL